MLRRSGLLTNLQRSVLAITISLSAFMTIQYRPYPFIFILHFPDKILQLPSKLQGKEPNSSFRRMAWQNLLCICLTSKCKNMFHGNHISVFFQFTSFRTTCLALNIIMYIRKKVLYTNICLFSSSPQPKFRIMQKRLFEKVKLRTYWRLPAKFCLWSSWSWQFSEKLFTEAATGVFCKKRCS